jgi:hypothetical protein
MERLYVVLYIDVSICDFKIYSNHEEALKEFLRFCLRDIKTLMKEVDVEYSDSDSIPSIDTTSSEDSHDKKSLADEEESDMTCILQVHEKDDDGNGYSAVREFDVEAFREFVSEMENVQEYIDGLDANLQEGVIPSEISEGFNLTSNAPSETE